ncbi:hypothetical protein Tco_0781963 [Tanacetum coccineum]
MQRDRPNVEIFQCVEIQEKPNLSKTQGASTPEKVSRLQRVPYASTIGSIMYAVRCTRPGVAFVQNLCSRFQQNPARVTCYTDVYKDDTKSQLGYVFLLNEGAVDWKSAKQSTIVMSSAESEYIVASEAAMEVV